MLKWPPVLCQCGSVQFHFLSPCWSLASDEPLHSLTLLPVKRSKNSWRTHHVDFLYLAYSAFYGNFSGGGWLLTSAQGGHLERRWADLGVRSLSGHGGLHLHVAALRRAERQAGQVFDGGVRILAVQRAAAHRRHVLQLCGVTGRDGTEVRESCSSLFSFY